MSRWQELVTMGRWQELVDDTLRNLESLEHSNCYRIDDAIWEAEKVAEMEEPVPLGENPTERVHEFKQNLRQVVFDRWMRDRSQIWFTSLRLLDHPESRDPEHRS